jgi:glycosyltransferase involved in cell wall biosynthesis
MPESIKHPAPIRVLMIGPYPASPDRIDGGVASALMYLSQALADDPSIELVGVRIAKGHLDASSVERFGWPVTDLPLGRMSLSTFYRRQRDQLRDLLKRFRPDIVHAQGADIAGYLAVGCDVPAVVTVHGLLAECAKFQTNFRSRLRAEFAALLTERYTVRRARHLIAISPYVTRYYEGAIGGIVHDIPNAVSSSFFRVARSPERGRLLYAGRISNGKGILELLEAVARNKGITRLVLAGAAPDPMYLKRVHDETVRLNLLDRVTFAGLLDEPALLQEFGLSEALVLPSFQETAPMVVQQAMACGLPVIASHVGGIPFQLDHDVTGWLFEPGNVEQLAELIARIGQDAEIVSRVGAAAKAVALERYSASTSQAQPVGLSQHVVSAGQSSNVRTVMSSGAEVTHNDARPN